MADKKTGNVIDFVLLKRVIAFAKPYKLQFMIAAIANCNLYGLAKEITRFKSTRSITLPVFLSVI